MLDAVVLNTVGVAVSKPNICTSGSSKLDDVNTTVIYADVITEPAGIFIFPNRQAFQIPTVSQFVSGLLVRLTVPLASSSASLAEPVTRIGPIVIAITEMPLF